MKNSLLLSCCFLFILAAGPTCTARSSAQQPEIQGTPVTDYTSLLAKLRAAGVNIEPLEEVDQPFFSVKGKAIELYGDHVQIFEYPNASAADAEARLVSPSGMAVGNTRMHWLGPPRFYKKEKLIVLYIGDNEKVTKALEGVLGRHFAGR
ncbi:MAG: hypothetical protein GEU77_03945 [Deltaproteobacteria bacterium]|nr:hypothetical protein [Deltaproteobacteria bacterium]